MYKKITILLSVVFGGFLFLQISCETCGPFPDRVKVTSIDWKNYDVTFLNGSEPMLELSEIENGVINYASLGIYIEPKTELYFASRFNPSGFIAAAYACDPIIPVNEEKIKGISIVSHSEYSSNYPAESDLSDLFDIIVFNPQNQTQFERYSLKDYIELELQIPVYFVLILNSPPDQSQEFEFEVTYYHEGIALDFYEFVTEKVFIEP